MISNRDADIIKDTLGSGYINKILEYFSLHNILNDKKKPYTKSSISRVISGSWQNEKIEDGIWDCFETITLSKQEKIERRKNLIQFAEEINND